MKEWIVDLRFNAPDSDMTSVYETIEEMPGNPRYSFPEENAKYFIFSMVSPPCETVAEALIAVFHIAHPMSDLCGAPIAAEVFDTDENERRREVARDAANAIAKLSGYLK